MRKSVAGRIDWVDKRSGRQVIHSARHVFSIRVVSAFGGSHALTRNGLAWRIHRVGGMRRRYGHDARVGVGKWFVRYRR